MLGDKTETFQGKGKSPEDVANHVEQYLKTNGFEVQTSAPDSKGVALQAKKHGFLREVIDADDDLTVRVGIGRWLEHLGVAALETLLVSELFLVIDVGEGAWTFEIEDKLLKDLKTYIG
jgi:hypothetical protein